MSSDLNNEETAKRLEQARLKFEQNYAEFKRKKLTEIPCFRSTFLTSKLFKIIINSSWNNSHTYVINRYSEWSCGGRVELFTNESSSSRVQFGVRLVRARHGRLFCQLSHRVQQDGATEQRARRSHEHDHQVQRNRARRAVSEKVQRKTSRNGLKVKICLKSSSQVPKICLFYFIFMFKDYLFNL